MINGKFTSLALLSMFTVGLAQSSAVGAAVDSGSSAATAVKVSKDKTGDTDKCNDNVKRDPPCTPLRKWQ